MIEGLIEGRSQRNAFFDKDSCFHELVERGLRGEAGNILCGGILEIEGANPVRA